MYWDPKEYTKSGGKPQVDNKKSFNDLMAEYEKMSKTNSNINPANTNTTSITPSGSGGGPQGYSDYDATTGTSAKHDAYQKYLDEKFPWTKIKE